MCSDEMFVLALFTDNIYLICNPADVSAFKKECPAVKDTDGKKNVRVLALHEDRVVLQEIQRSLEKEENTVFFKNIDITDDKLIFSDVVKKNKKYRDESKLYLDSAILPSRGANSEGYVFLLPDRETKNFFQIQTDFVETKIHIEKLQVRDQFKKSTKKSGQKKQLVMVKGRKVSAQIHENANDLVRAYVFPYMREDEIVRGVRYDKLVIEYANKQCEKNGLHHYYDMIRARVRLLGRFLLTVKNIDNDIKELSDVFKPRNYINSMKAVRIVAEFNETTQLYARPALALILCTLLNNAGTILRSE